MLTEDISTLASPCMHNEMESEVFYNGDAAAIINERMELKSTLEAFRTFH